jgi:hypothetical protein
MRRLTQRMLRAATLDVSLYEEVETDPRATGQAVGVVVLSSLAAGIGLGARGGVSGIVIGTLTTLLGWYAWAYLIYFFGVFRIFGDDEFDATIRRGLSRHFWGMQPFYETCRPGIRPTTAGFTKSAEDPGCLDAVCCPLPRGPVPHCGYVLDIVLATAR